MSLVAVLQTEVDAGELADAFEGDGLTAQDWITAGIVLAVAILAALILRRLVARSVAHRDGTPMAAQLISRLLAYLLVVAGFVYSLSALGVRVGPLLGALGIGGVALAFALQDIIENFVAALIIQVRRPFAFGDQVVMGEFEGTVEDINARTVVLRTPAGERVFVPAGDVLDNAIVNLTTLGSRRTTLDVGVAYETDLAQAREVLLETLDTVDQVRVHPAPEVYVSEFGDSAINLAVRYWHEPSIASFWSVRNEVALRAKEALDREGIEIAFPQMVLRRDPDDR